MLGALVVTTIVLLLTGIDLVLHYRPGNPGSLWIADAREVHRLASRIAIQLLIGVVVLSALVARERGLRLIALASAGLLLALAASVTGYLLPWDQLAIHAFGEPHIGDGYLAVFDSRATSVLVGGVEVGLETFRRWFVVHTLVLPALGIAVSAIAWRSTRRQSVAMERHERAD